MKHANRHTDIHKEREREVYVNPLVLQLQFSKERERETEKQSETETEKERATKTMNEKPLNPLYCHMGIPIFSPPFFSSSPSSPILSISIDFLLIALTGSLKLKSLFLLASPESATLQNTFQRKQATKRAAIIKAARKPNVRPRMIGRLEAVVGASVVTAKIKNT